METPTPNDEKAALAARRRKLNIALALALGAFVVIFYVLTIAKFGPNVLTRDL